MDNVVGGSSQVIVSNDANNSLALGSDFGAYYNDGDNLNSNELITASVLFGNTLTITEGGNDFDIDLTGLGGGGEIPDNELITNAILNGTDLVITEAGTDFTVPLGSLAGGNQDLASVLGVGTGAGGNQIKDLLNPTDPQDAATQNYVETRIADILAAGGGDPTDEFIDSFTLNNTELNIVEGLNIVPPLDLDPIFATDAELATAITASSQVIVSADLPNSLAIGTDGGALYNDLDTDATNELQNITEVLNAGNNAGGVVLSNFGNPLVPQDAATKIYVDTEILASNQIIVSTGAPNSIISGIDGGALYNDLDGSPTNEIQNIGEVLAEGNNAGGLLIKNIGVPLDPLDAATKDYVDSEISSIAAPLIVSANIPNSIAQGTDGGALYDDPDADPNNEIQNITEVLADGNDAGGALIKNIGTPVDPADASTKAYVDAQVVAAGTIVSADLPNSIAQGTDGGALYDDPDADPNNEIQNITEVLADGNDAGGALIKNIGTPVDPADASTKAYVDAQVVAAGTIVSADLPNSIAQGTDGGALYDDPDSDPNNEIQNITEVLADGNDAGGALIKNIGTPVDPADASTKAYVDAQVVAAGTIVSADLPNSIAQGTDGGALYDDPDADPNNEIQTISSTDGSLTISQTGINYDISVVGGGNDDQIAIEVIYDNSVSGLPNNVQTAIDALAAANAADNDTDATNEIQTITSTDNSITIVQTGNDYDISIGSVQGSFGGGPSVIVNNTIGQADIGDGAIGPGEIQSNAVSSDEIEDDSIVNADISSSAAIAGTKINPNFGAQDVITNGDFISGGTTLDCSRLRL